MSRVLELFIVKLKKDVQNSLSKKEREKASKYGRTANGNSKLWGTVKASVQPKTDPVKVTLTMEDYWKFVDVGRKKGGVSKQGQEKISSWVKRKGLNPSKIIDEMRMKAAIKKKAEPTKSGKPRKAINLKKTPFPKAQKQLAYLVSRKIKTEGYKGSDFFSEVINDGRLDKLKTDLTEEIKKDIIIEFRNGSNDNK